jgi:Fe-S cluster assembly ATP-binding protein
MIMKRTLNIKGWRVRREGKEVVRGVDLDIPAGAVHALMGPNGSGKSSLANSLMGHPKYEVLSGRLTLDGQALNGLGPDGRSKKGLFLSMQYPPEVAGVSVAGFLRAAVNSRRPKPYAAMEFYVLLKKKMAELGISEDFAGRGLNEGFSGGEKKRMEILQMSLLEPKYAVLDETDSGLDVDALKAVSRGVEKLRGLGAGILLITHYTRILKYLKPDRVHVMVAGRIVRSGGKDLAALIEKKGYAAVQR